MIDQSRLIFIHGLMGSSSGVKATLLREKFPGILTPDFSGSLDERMESLAGILADKKDWTLIGSSFGGLMAAIFACNHPHQVKHLILLAPALIWPEFTNDLPDPIHIPVTIYHGIHDELIPVFQVKEIAEKIFMDLEFKQVEDDHGLYNTVHDMDWELLLRQA